MKPRLTYANVVSTITAVAVFATGTAWAAATIGAGDIKSNAVKSRHIATNAVMSSDVKNRSLRGADIGLKTIGESNLTPAARTSLGGTTGYALRATVDSPWQVNMVDTKAIRINLSCFAGYSASPEQASNFSISLGSEGDHRAWMTISYAADNAPAGFVRTQVGPPDYFVNPDPRTGTGGGTILAGIGTQTMYEGVFAFKTDDAANTCDSEWAISKVAPI